MRAPNRARQAVAATVIVTVGLLAATPMLGVASTVAGAPAPDLRADLNRDGRVDLDGPGDKSGAETWTRERGAIFLPNLDDDERRCQVSQAELDEVGLEVDRRLAACNDAADDRVNGPDDEADLAPMRIGPQPGLSATAFGQLELDAVGSSYARVFVRRGGGLVSLRPEGDGRLSAAELRAGVELAIEGRDIVRDPAKWNGEVTVTLTVTDQGRQGQDRVRLRVAPLLLHHDLQPAVKVFAGSPAVGPGWPTGGGFNQLPPNLPQDWPQFAASLSAATKAAGLPAADLKFTEGSSGWWKDLWWQDIFEPATVSMPASGGVHTMRVLIRSANLLDLPGTDGLTHLTLRPAARLVFRDLRGPGIGVVQEFTEQGRDYWTDLRNAGGNFESLPPYRTATASYPQGRSLYGSGAVRKPDPAFTTMLDAQGYQPPLVMDTDWLLAGHPDETVHVVRADNARGWTLMVADPRLAVTLLRQAKNQGAGRARLFEGVESVAKPTVAEVLRDTTLLGHNETAARHIDKQLAMLLAETGLRSDEVVRAPVLFTMSQVAPLLRAFTPGVVNGISLTPREFAAPDPHGPVVRGQDLFRQATTQALAANGVTVHWVEDFRWAHLLGGEVHCSTNALRDTSAATPWWTDR